MLRNILSVRPLVVMLHTADIVSRSFANPTLASKFFIVVDRSSISRFTSIKKHENYHYYVHSESRTHTDKTQHAKTGSRLTEIFNKTFKYNNDNQLLKS